MTAAPKRLPGIQQLTLETQQSIAYLFIHAQFPQFLDFSLVSFVAFVDPENGTTTGSRLEAHHFEFVIRLMIPARRLGPPRS